MEVAYVIVVIILNYINVSNQPLYTLNLHSYVSII